MIGAGALVTVLSIPLRIGRGSGALLLCCGAAYLCFDYWRHRRSGAAVPEPAPAIEIKSVPKSILLFGFGALMVLGGSELLCRHGVALARQVGVPPIVIGLTMVAVGTSVPELVTAVHAARKSVPDLSLGNVVGANILNLTLVTGTASTISPLAIRQRAQHVYMFAVMLGVFVLLKIMARTGQRLSRREGWVLLSCYAAYLVGLGVLGYIG
jgi:cation:H+ antiporter